MAVFTCGVVLNNELCTSSLFTSLFPDCSLQPAAVLFMLALVYLHSEKGEQMDYEMVDGNGNIRTGPTEANLVHCPSTFEHHGWYRYGKKK